MNASVGIKCFFGVVTAVLYGIAGQAMLRGATATAGYIPNSGLEWLTTMSGAAMTTFVAAQIGVVVATTGSGLMSRVRVSLFGETNVSTSQDRSAKFAVAILILDVVVLSVVGIWFVLLLADPSRIKVPIGGEPLKEAPAYVSLQAKTYVALVLAGAAGIGVAAK